MVLNLEKPNHSYDQPPPARQTSRPDVSLTAIAIVGGMVLAALGVLIALVILGDESDGNSFEIIDDSTTSVPATSTPDPTTKPSVSPTSTTPTSTTPTSASMSSEPSTDSSTTTATAPTTSSFATDTSFQSSLDVVWPDPGQTNGFETPEDVAHSFAVDVAGFREPLIGKFRAGDGRSGEIEIQPAPTGPTTVVLLRQATTDDSWWVVAATTDEIILDRPQVGDAIDQTLELAGRAQAFEGNITVVLYQHGDDEALAITFVTGWGDGPLVPIDKELQVYPNAIGPGFLLLTAPTAEDGSTRAVTAVALTLNGLHGPTDR